MAPPSEGPGRGGRSAAWLSAAEAAARLGVRRDTLYAYVSRGLVRSEPQPGTRARRYDAQDIERLRGRREARRDPAKAAEEALHFGTPVLESAITRIDAGQLFYRGRDACELARTHRFENVAGWLWGRPLEDGLPASPGGWPALWKRPQAALDRLPRLEAFQTVLVAAAAEEASGYSRDAELLRRHGAHVLDLETRVAAREHGGNEAETGIAARLRRAWAPRRRGAHAALEAALVLWADHELNVSTFTVRCVTSAGASAYAAVVAGLSALRGARHGGQTEQVEALFDEVARPERAASVLGSRLRRGELIPGFGHPLYPDGDPRARTLASVLADASTSVREMELAEAIAEQTERLIGRAPNVDFATTTLRRGLGLPGGSALALVGIARSAGWIAHLLEQVTDARLIRPRARYVGPIPGEVGA